MPRGNRTRARSSKRRMWKGLLIVALVVAVGGGAVWALRSRTQVGNDKLCEWVEAQGLRCPILLGSSSVFRPGSITRISEEEKQKRTITRVQLPSSQLDTACLLPGTTLVLPPAEPTQSFDLPSFSYEVRRSASAGVALPIPQVQGVDIKAGPKASQLESVRFSAGQATLTMLDENHLAGLIADCRIKPSCVERITNLGDKVVNAALTAERVSYEFVAKGGRSLSVGAAIEGKVISLEGDFGSDATAETTFQPKNPVVLGVTLVRDEVLANTTPCVAEAVFSVEGDASVAIGGGGGDGHIGRTRRQIKVLGTAAALSDRGDEESECSDGYERTRSKASARAFVARGAADNELALEALATSRGGHYATAATCAGGRLIGISGHDTSASSSATLRGRINALVRREGKATLRVSWQGLGAPALLSVIAPDGRAVLPDTQIRGEGSQDVEVPGGGMYGIVVKADLVSSANGADSGPNRSLDGRLRAELLP